MPTGIAARRSLFTMPAKKVAARVPKTTTVGDVLSLLAHANFEPRWPPDVFAIVAFLLHKSGAYTKAIEAGWPPVTATNPAKRRAQALAWAARTKELGDQWRETAERQKPAPLLVLEYWEQLVKNRQVLVQDIPDNRAVWEALLHLCAVADEACAGVGVVNEQKTSKRLDRFDIEATQLLLAKATLCFEIDSKLVRVLPKLHTPQVGMTVRSLTHHLALCPSGDIHAEWYKYPSVIENPRSLNLLLVPWPTSIQPRDFKPIDPPPEHNMDRGLFGFFSFAPERGSDVVKHTTRLFEQAEKIVGRVDAVILPEAALNRSQYDKLKREITTKRRAMLIAGVSEEGRPRKKDYRFWTELLRCGYAICVRSTGPTQASPLEGEQITDSAVRAWRHAGSAEDLVGAHRCS